MNDFLSLTQCSLSYDLRIKIFSDSLLLPRIIVLNGSRFENLDLADRKVSGSDAQSDVRNLFLVI